jgi:hypothetical protein
MTLMTTSDRFIEEQVDHFGEVVLVLRTRSSSSLDAGAYF